MSDGRRHHQTLTEEHLAAEWRSRLRRGRLSAIGSVEGDGSPLAIDFLAKVRVTDSRHLEIDVELFESAAAVDSDVAKLTERERRIVDLIAGGLRTPDIAQRLYISPATVRTHVRNAMSKLKVHTRAQLVAVALAGIPGTEQQEGGE